MNSYVARSFSLLNHRSEYVATDIDYCCTRSHHQRETMKKFLPLPMIAVASIFLASCSGSTEAEPSVAPSSSAVADLESPPALEAPMEFEAEPSELTVDSDLFAMAGMTAGKVNLGLEARPDQELLDALKKADPDANWTFVELTIDNREGSEDAFNHEIRAYDASGKEYGYVRPIELLDPLLEELGETEFPHELYEKLWEKYDTEAHPGAVKKFVMITGDEIPKELKRVTISFGGMVGEADAMTIEDAKSQGLPTDF